MTKIIEQVKKFVEEECKKPTSKYGYEIFTYHFVYVAKYWKELAKELGADVEVVEIACWLHDIWWVIYWREDHHITWAKIAEEKLREFGYPEEKIELVKKCIYHHRCSTNFERESLEEKIVSDADALSNFENLSWLFKAAFVYENLTQGEARISVREKYERKWEKLELEKSREIIKPKYEAVILLLKD